MPRVPTGCRRGSRRSIPGLAVATAPSAPPRRIGPGRQSNAPSRRGHRRLEKRRPRDRDEWDDGVGSGNDARSMVFVLPVRARVSRVVLRAGADGVAAAGPGGPPSVTLAAGDDVSAVSSGAPIATWTLGGSDAMRAGSHLNTDSNRRALRGGEPVALVLAEPTPPARVLRLTAANVTGGAGSSSSGSSPFTGEDFTGTSSSSALEMRSARFVIRPSFPNPATKMPPRTRVEVEVCESLRDLADAGDPTRDSVARLSTRPEVARALEDSASPGIRSRVPVSSEEAHSNGSVLHVGLPPASRT